MKRRLHLLIIDPQNDFCDLPPGYLPVDPLTAALAAPALPVPGAHADMLRVAELIRLGAGGWTDISITLDSHHRLDIAHPTFWQTGQGGAVTPFTQISAAAVRERQFVPRNPASLARALVYLDTLEAAGRYQLMVWPVHCEIGSWGHDVHADVRAAYNEWEDAAQAVVTKLIKGSNPWTEHYSAVMAEVPDEEDPDSQLNQGFIDMLKKADRVCITGEAGSHCVKATVEHIVDNVDAADLSKFVLLTDCMSPVSGFEVQYAGFVEQMRARGLQVAKAADVLPDVISNSRS